MMLGDRISAEEAERMGMIYRVLPDETFMEEVDKIAQTLAEMPTKGLAFTKQALNLSMEQGFEQQLNTEDSLQQKAAATNDFKEGVDAFMGKRKPEFRGD
jgi:2-(1,2-epoxy-1,2-dihydrophenyl)acetyl-CoA isomerase